LLQTHSISGDFVHLFPFKKDPAHSCHRIGDSYPTRNRKTGKKRKKEQKDVRHSAKKKKLYNRGFFQLKSPSENKSAEGGRVCQLSCRPKVYHAANIVESAFLNSTHKRNFCKFNSQV